MTDTINIHTPEEREQLCEIAKEEYNYNAQYLRNTNLSKARALYELKKISTTSLLNPFKNNNIYNCKMQYIIFGIEENFYTRKQVITAICFLMARDLFRGHNDDKIYGIAYTLLKRAPNIKASEIIDLINRTRDIRKKNRILNIFVNINKRYIILNIFNHDVIHDVIKYCNALEFAKEIT